MRYAPIRYTICAINVMAMLFLATVSAQAQTLTVSGVLGGGPTFRSPVFSPPLTSPGAPIPPTSLANLGENFFFDSFAFSVTQNGNYVFGSTATLTSADFEFMDGPPALFLYLGTFNPAQPLQNVLFGATTINFDDGGNLLLPVTISLSQQAQYTLVTTSLFALDFGVFETTCGPTTDNPNGRCERLSTSVVPEPSTVVLSASGLLAMAFIARRRKSR